MSSHKAPNTHCVHIFDGEFQLLNSRSQTLENNSCCFLYGLWTHTSNAVVHLVVLTKKEIDYAEKHNLDCVGYVAKCYKKTLYNSVLQLTKLSSTRQHIIVDVRETTRSRSLKAYGTHHDVVRISEEASSQGHPLQVNILRGESPFRNEFFKAYPQLKNTKDYKSETENGYDQNGQEHIYKVGGVKPVGKELYEMNRGSKRAKTTEHSAERDTAFYKEDTINGYQAKLDPNSIDIKHFRHKIKVEFDVSDDELLHAENSEELSYYFKHNYKQWEIVLSQDPESGNKMAEIISESTEVPSSPKTSKLQKFSTENVVGEIKKMCQCKACGN